MYLSFDQIEGYIADLESLKDDMMDLFGDWEGVEPDKVKFEALGGMEDLVELGEETQLVESDVSESVDTFKVGLNVYMCVHELSTCKGKV